MANAVADSLQQMKQQLDTTGPGFCLAKWKQVTMHLQNGHTHSCHHPASHHVPLEEVLQNPTALHNTQYKKTQRRMMLSGGRPSECDYCWRVEDQGNGSLSDRVYKSAEPWAKPYHDAVLNHSWDHDVDPSYVEVSFGNVCNFKCSYCSPHVSSKWMEEIQSHGPYDTSGKFNNLDWIKQQNLMPIPHNQDNPYVDAFWAWWPRMYQSLMHFRITGGEPLLNKNTFKVLDWVIDNPNPELQLSINTNLCPPREIMAQARERFKRIIGEGKVKKFKLFTSAEAWGAAAEYIRHGMDYNQWHDNICQLLTDIPGMEFTVMSTYNLLSVTTYDKFLADMLQIRQQFRRHGENYAPLHLDIPYLRYPEHQSVFIADHTVLPLMADQVTYMYQHPDVANWFPLEYNGFWPHEIDKLKRIYWVTHSHINKQRDASEAARLAQLRRDFVAFVDTHDRRRGTDFAATFPDLVDFYRRCQTAC